MTLREPPAKHDFGGQLAKCDYFTVDAVQGGFFGVAEEKSFVSVLITEGAGTLTCGEQKQDAQKGDSS